MIYLPDLPDIMKVAAQTLTDPIFEQLKINVTVLRLDKIHAIISGNKWFKLKYYLKRASDLQKKGVVTFGGAFSNHLIATAYACKQSGLSSIGVIRGEEPAVYSPTLQDAGSYGMKLLFQSRQAYKDRHLILELQQSHPDYLLVEEGGRGHLGVKGAEEILHLVPSHHYTHILCAIGTGTMISGIINSALVTQQIIGIPVIKMANSHCEAVEFINAHTTAVNFSIQNDFHFGGYAKKNNTLIQFMNDFYHQHAIPTDFVYTGKLFYGAMKLVEKNFFVAGSNILIIHSGGLQGNRSLPEGLLHFNS